MDLLIKESSLRDMNMGLESGNTKTDPSSKEDSDSERKTDLVNSLLFMEK